VEDELGRRRVWASLERIWLAIEKNLVATEKWLGSALAALRAARNAASDGLASPARPNALATAPPAGLLGRVRLGTQLIVGIVVIAVSVAAIMGFLAWRAERRYLAEHLLYEHERTFNFARSPLLDDLMRRNRPGVEATMRQLVARDPQIYSAVLFGKAGTTLFEYRRGSERPEFVVPLKKPVDFLGETFGTVVIEWDESELASMVFRRASMIALAVGSACVALGLLVFLFVQVLVVRPIDGISRRILALQDGRFSHTLRLSESASVELKRLNASVDALAEFLILKDRRELELREAKELAELGSRAKSEFLANVSHELRTPLNAINGFSELMLSEALGPLGSQQYKGYVQNIHDSGTHLLEIIDDILDMSNLEAGKLPLELTELDVGEVARACVETAGPSAKEKGVELSVEVADDTPVVRADRRRTRQVLANLLSNAVKFTAEGGRVGVAVAPAEAGGVRVAVSDTGIGIPADKIDAVLDAFGQVEGAFSRSRGGTGLGLTLANRLVVLHGGKLSLTSAVGIGTEASFTLPARPPETQPTTTPQPEAAIARSA
jgi:signal transduction histidine kinase